MPIIQNDSGIAFGYSMMLLSIVFFSVVWIALSIPTNQITEDMNKAVADGIVSEQTAIYYDMAVRIFTWIIPLAFMGIVAWWGFTRANLTDGEL